MHSEKMLCSKHVNFICKLFHFHSKVSYICFTINQVIDSCMIFNIQRFSTHDGEGIRTLVFFKGCPLRCQWCSNPEGLSFGYSLMYDKRICRNFGDCIKANSKVFSRENNNGIRIDRELLGEPEMELVKLNHVCASKALSISGELLSVNELLTEIEKDIPFYREDGGVTLSGGEPLSQGEDLTSLLQQLKDRNISVNIETSMHVEWERVVRRIGLVDTFLVDLKHTDKDKFKIFTGGDAELVMDNLKKLTNSNAHVIIRIPVIPGFNHSEHEIIHMIEFAGSLKDVSEIHLLPYHTFGLEKYKMLGMDYRFGLNMQVQESELEPYLHYIRSKGLQAIIGG